jgi:hypothetical protein
MFFKWRKLYKHLGQHGVRAPATVVDIAKHGVTHRAEGWNPLDELADATVGQAPNSAAYEVRKTRLRIRPSDEPEFEVEGKMRWGDYGTYVPKAGEEIEVIYDPNDHEKVVLAPPTAEQEALRTAEALSKAKVGFQIGGGGAKAGGSGKPPTEEQVTQQAQAMDQAQGMMQLAQQYMSGELKPGQVPGSPPGAAAEASAAAAEPDDAHAKLERLQALKESGALTEAEFEAEKKKLLG